MQPLQTQPVFSGSGPSREHRQWAMFIHLSALIGLIIPFGHILGPLVLWLVKREESGFVDAQGKEAVNFNLTVMGFGLLLAFMIFATWMSVIGIPIGIFLIFVAFALMLYGVIMPIIAAMNASEGKPYRYPATLRIVG